MDPDVVQLSNGKKYRLQGFGSLAPEQQAQRVAQAERELRVGTAATTLATRDRERRENSFMSGVEGPVSNAIRETGDEFARNFTLGLGDYAGAAASYVNFGPEEEDPFNGLDFWERRDALRAQQDMEAEQYLPGWVDDTASLTGVLTSGGTGLLKTGFGNSVKAGAGLGAVEGFGNSEGENLGDAAQDALLGGAVGGVVGGAADIILDKGVGGLARGVFAEQGTDTVQGSKAAYLTQKSLGIEPSLGSIGNKTARTLENSFAENPVAAGISESTRRLPLIVAKTGRSSIDNQLTQQDQLADALVGKVTGPLRTADPTPLPPGATIPKNDADLAVELRRVARVADEGYGAEISGLENQFKGLVPPKTPVNISRTRDLPANMVKDGNSAKLAQRTQSEIDSIMLNPRSPVNTGRDASMNRQLGTIDGQVAQIDSQLGSLGNMTDPQAKRLLRTREKLVRDRTRVTRLIDRNKGPAFSALRQDRSMIGSQVGEGLNNVDSKFLYEAITRDLEGAAARAGGPNARKAFRDMTKREREIFLSKELIKPMTTTEGAAANVNAIKRAVVGGNDAEFAALTSNLPPNEMNALRANLLESLGRNLAQDPFVPKAFADNWKKMSTEAKAKITNGDPGTTALLDAIADTAESFNARGMASNRSNSASAAGVMAFLGASVGSPGKILTFLSSAAGADRVIASEALAKAVAGQPTALGQLVRRAVYGLPASPEASEILFGEGQQ